MKRHNKKGFTIVELVIVVAVIAILSAVLIPTFAGIVKKANLSADQQAVRQMNTLIATYDDVDSIEELKANLKADNIDATNYKPMTAGAQFFWNEDIILLVGEDGKVIYPENLKDTTQGSANWWSLSGEGNKAAAEDFVNGALTGSVDMQGASINIDMSVNNIDKLGGTDTAPVTIENVVSDEGSKANKTGEFVDYKYYAGLIKIVPAGKTIYVENLVIDGAVIGDTTNKLTETGRVGIIAGQVNGTLIIKNVTIKNSSVFAGFRVGALVGAVNKNATVEIDNVTFENVTVTGETQTAKLIGEVKGNSHIKIGTINGADQITIVKAMDAPASAIDSQGRVTYVNSQYPNGNTTCAYATNEYFWVQRYETYPGGFTWNDSTDQSKGYVSDDVAMSVTYNWTNN